jgi:hypothetical protein
MLEAGLPVGHARAIADDLGGMIVLEIGCFKDTPGEVRQNGNSGLGQRVLL